jgi:DNA repair exonuclease SbcCD ATPase subunit
MKNIIFETLKFQNFLSVGDSAIEINFTQGINIITGENLDNIGSRNGIGKTTILNALYWNIFGETINDLKKSRIQNNKSKNECYSILNFSIEKENFKIKRTLEPASIKIFKNDEDITLSTIEKNNEYICEALGINQDVFKNSVILTSDNTIPFMAQKKIEKRKFIEGVMNLNIFSEMLLKIRKDYNDTKKISDTKTALFSTEQKNLENLKKQKIHNETLKTDKINSLLKRIEDNKKEIKNIQNNDLDVINTIKTLQEDLNNKEKKIHDIETKEFIKINEKLKEFEISLNVKKSKLIDLNKELTNIKKSTGVCPSCKRAYSEDTCSSEKRINEIEEEICTIKDDYNKISEEEQTLKLKLNKIKEIVQQSKIKNNQIKNEIERLKNLNNQIKIIETKNEEILKNIETLKEEKDNTDILIENLTLEIKTIQEEIKSLYKELDILENAKLIVSEEGVKTIIIKKILKFLNERLNFYLLTLEAPCSCHFDDTFDTTIKTLNGKDIDYWNLSGGERKRVDAAVIFTFQDLLKMQTGVNFNISIYDEWADSALDEKGLIKFLEILRNKVNKENESIYIISHNPNISNMDIDNVIFLQKKNGITLIKQ